MKNGMKNGSHSQVKPVVDSRTTEEICSGYKARLKKALIQIREVELLLEARENGGNAHWYTLNGNTR